MERVDLFLAVIAIFLAAVVGFAVHRASLCNVRAVAELLSTHRAHMLLSFLKTVLWVILATFILQYVFRVDSTQPLQSWDISTLALIGGFVFGVGAAINGGCALGTLGRLGNGELRMLLTLVGLGLGLAAGGYSQIRHWLPSPEKPEHGTHILAVLNSVGFAFLALWALLELLRLWRHRDRELPWHKRMLGPRYRLSSAALLLGLSNGVIYSLFGPWSYTRTARTTVNQVVMGRPGAETFYWLLFFAVLGGVLISSLTRRGFVLDWRLKVDWLRNLFGGILMGVGVTLIPGGNDVLILHTIPGGSPHALPAYAALLVGTAAGLMVIRALGGSLTKVECTGDICRIRTADEN